MKKQVFLRWLWCVMEYLMYFPLVLIAAGVLFPYRTVVILLPTLPLHLLFALVLTSVLKKFRNLLAVLIGTVYTVFVVFVFSRVFLAGSLNEIIAVAAGTVLFYVWGIRAGTGETQVKLVLYSGGLIVHIVSLFLINNIEVLKPYFNMAMWVSISYCLAGLPLANRRFLINETYEKSSLKIIPGSVNRGNIIVVILTLFLIIILSLWRALLDSFMFVAESAAKGILKILKLLGDLYKPDESGLVDIPPAEMSGALPAGEKNPVVDLVLNIITVLILAVILFFVIRYIVRNYKKIYQAFYNFLSSLLNRFHKWSSTEQGYFDREESLLKTEIQKRAPVLRKLFRRYPKWRDMKDNESRVRFLYTKFVTDYIKKGLKLRLSYTPSEVVEQAEKLDGNSQTDHSMLKDVYNDVRYGAKKVDDETVRILKEKYL